MDQDQPVRGNTRARPKGLAWALTAAAVSSLASLTALILTASSNYAPLIVVQAVAAGASLCASGLLFQCRCFGPAYVAASAVEQSPEKGKEPSSTELLDNKRRLGLVEEL